jgi:hypothetical protein
MIVRLALALGLAALSCTPPGDRSAVSAGSVNGDASAPPDAGARGAEDGGGAADGGESVLGRYGKREWFITRASGTVVYEAYGDHDCKALPEARPPGLTVILGKRGGDPGDWTYFGVSEAFPCRFAWSMPWLDPPPAVCRAIGPAALDRLYADFRALSPHTIRTRHLENVSPHRGGWSVGLRFGQTECQISDIMDSEVHEGDQRRFDAAQDLIRKVYQDEPRDGGR